jgi:hypothetical protein
MILILWFRALSTAVTVNLWSPTVRVLIGRPIGTVPVHVAILDPPVSSAHE